MRMRRVSALRAEYWRLAVAVRLSALIVSLAIALPTEAQCGTVSLLILYVPEHEACAPDGYGSQGVASDRDCATLDYQTHVTRWEENRNVPRHTACLNTDTPELRLGDALRQIINSYVASPSRGRDRRAVVFVFDFGEGQTGQISLERSDRGTRRWVGDLGQDRRWIVHQAVHWLHPFNQFTWTLEMPSGAAFTIGPVE